MDIGLENLPVTVAGGNPHSGVDEILVLPPGIELGSTV
jgi:hypothetical protein